MQQTKQNTLVWLSWITCYLYSGNVLSAAPPEELDIKKDPVTIPVGPFEFAPILEVGESYNDNIFMRNSLKKGSLLTQTHAGAKLTYDKQFNKYDLIYALQDSEYHESPADSYLDNFVGFNTYTEFTSRNRLNIDLKYLSSHYQRGVFLGRDLVTPTLISTEPDKYHQYGLEGSYLYGHSQAKGNLELRFNVDEFKFISNLSRTAVQDRDQIAVTPGFFYRLLPNTRLQAQVETSWVSLKNSTSATFNNNKQRFLIGANWTYSKQINAMARIGYLRQEFDVANLQGYENITWDINMNWYPLSYSRVDFTMSRDASASINSTNIRTSDRYRLAWKHDWTSRISTELNGALEGAYNTTALRQDDYKSFGIDINYGLKRWLGFGVNYAYRSLQSGNQTLNFDQNQIMFYITGNPRISDDVRTPWATWY